MFLDWVASLQLLEPNKDTNILKDFSLPVKRILVSQVVNLFLDVNTSPSILTTNAHVHWVLECVGQGFLLPVEDLTVITACIELYKRWLLETNPKARPPPIIEDEQHFTRVMLQHLSLIFTPRTGVSKESIDVHTVLCQRVLSIFLEFGRTCKPSVETWEVALKLMLGVSDCILGSERPLDDPQVKIIAPSLLKVLFELWLHARSTDPDLWASLVKLTNNWLHLMPMAAQWNATTLGLTNRMLTLLYPHNEIQHSFVTIKTSEADTINIDLSSEHVFYAWHRMLHVIGNPNRLTNPAIFLCAMTGLNNLVCQFLKVGRSAEQREKADVPRPNGNTILHIFGSWLFEAVKLNRPGFDEGTAIAVEALNHTYNASQHPATTTTPSSSSSSSSSPLAPVYLASFYQCMAEALGSDGRVLMSAIQYGQWLLFSELSGARVLVPLYHPAVTAPDVIRRCCIKILGGLICLPNRFGDLTIPTIHNKPLKLSDKNLTDIVSYKDTLPHISHLLLSGLSTEKSAHNTELLLWYIPVFLKELAAAVRAGTGTPVAPSDFAVGAVEVIVSSICSSVWNHDVSQAACRVLSAVSRMHASLPNGADIGFTLTKSLCEFAINRIGVSPHDEDLAAAIIMCVTDWALVDQWLITKRAALEVFIDVCMLGLGAREHPPEPEHVVAAATTPGRSTPSSPTPARKQVQRQPPGDKLKQAAQHGLLNVLHNIGNFPATNGPARISSLISEEDVLQRIREADPTITDPEDFVRYFIVDESFMLSVIDIPNGTSDPTCVVVIRDRTGKHVWNASKPYLAFNPKKESEIEDKDSNELVHNESTDDLTKFASPLRSNTPGGRDTSPNTSARPRALVSEGSSGDLKLLVAVEADISKRNRGESYQDLLSYINMHSDDTFLTLSERVRESETSLLGQFKDQTMAVQIATQPPARLNPYIGPNKFQLGRQLLTSLGLFSSCHSKVVPLHPGPPLSACIRALDTIAERTQHKVGVIFTSKERSQEDPFANLHTSADFKDFLATLGWPVHVPTHRGFLGGLDPKGQHGTEAPYYSNYALETIFLASSLMPNNFTASDPDKPNTTHKKSLLRGIPVVIVWAEDNRFDTTTLTEGVPLQIVVIPQSSGMYRVRILKTTSVSKIHVGPISEDIIISKQILGDMVRETAIVASQLIAPTIHPSYIEQMSRSFKTPNMSMDAFYGKIFGTMPKTSFTNTPSGAAGGMGDKGLTLRRGGQVGLKFAFTPPPPPSVAPAVNTTPEKFNLASSFENVPALFASNLAQPSPPSPAMNEPKDLTKTTSDPSIILPIPIHPIATLSGSGDGIKLDKNEGLSRTPSFGSKEALPTPSNTATPTPTTAPIPIPSNSSSSNVSTTPNHTPTKRNSTPVGYSPETPPSEFAPPSPSPPTPPIGATTSPAQPPAQGGGGGFVPGKAWKGSRPTAGRPQSPFVPQEGGEASTPPSSSSSTTNQAPAPQQQQQQHHHHHHHHHHREGHQSQPPSHRAGGLFEIGGRKSNK